MRRVARRDAHAEVERVTLLPPPAARLATRSRIASVMRTARSAAFGTGTGSLKNTIIPSPVKRSRVPSWREDQLAHRGVILAQHRHDLLRLGRFGERSEAAQVEEHHRDLPPVATQRVLGAAGDDQLGELRREEALEPTQAAELLQLFVDALLKGRVPFARARPPGLPAAAPRPEARGRHARFLSRSPPDRRRFRGA